MESHTFYFKEFQVRQDACAMKVGTDGVLLGSWSSVQDVSRILDIGAGTGVVALMMAQRTVDAMVDALEIELAAYRQCADNFLHSPWSGRLNVLHTSVQDFARQPCEGYDLIVTNPPFFTGGTFSENQTRNEVRHTVKLPHGDLLIAVQRLLKPTGRFCVVLPHLEGLRFKELASEYHLYCVRMTQVRSKPGKPIERLLMEFACNPADLRLDELTIQSEQPNQWTEGYTELTKPFYLFM